MADYDPRVRETPNNDRSSSGVRPASNGRDVWRASASFGWLIGTLLLLLSGAGIVVLLLRVPSASGGQRVAWIAAAVALTVLTLGIAVVLRALPTMRYRFVEDALVIEWLGQQHIVPIAEITEVTFEPTVPLKLPGWEPFWPGYYVATVRTPSGLWRSWATQKPHRRVRLTTATGTVAISPERPIRFITELERRQRAAGYAVAAPEPARDNPPSSWAVDQLPDQSPLVEPSRDVAAISGERQRPRLTAPRRPRQPTGADRGSIAGWLLAFRDQFRDGLLADQVASALVAIGVVLPVLMVAYLYSQYEGLPTAIPIQWDASGDVAELTTPSGLWRFPRIAVTLLVVNTVLATLVVSIDRFLSRLLVAGIPLAQLILFIALVRAIN